MASKRPPARNAKEKESRIVRDVAVWTMIAAVGVAVVILFTRGQTPPLAGTEGSGSPGGNPTPSTPSTPPGSTPAQWYYDKVNDRHWHNDHWDPGPPPANASTGVSTGSTGVASANQSPLPGGQIPTPWYHDVANNRHWHAPHGHWHDGPPPPLGSRR